MSAGNVAKATANPEIAEAGLERLLEIKPGLANDPEALTPLAHVFSASPFLTDWLTARPEEIDWAMESGCFDKPKNREEMAANLSELLERFEPKKALRRFKHREMFRVCAREIGGAADVAETLMEWTAVADISLDAAIKICEADALKIYGEPRYTEIIGDEEKVAKFAALGLGKLGGEELNISSDIDLIFIHTSDNGTTTGPKKVHCHEYFVRIAREVKSLLHDVTEEGFVFRVDLDLRPEGKAGEITNSIGAMEIYYESWGQHWERQALIKARHCGGHEEVSAETLGRLRPFVYRKYLDHGALSEISSMKDKIDLSLKSKKRKKEEAVNVKLGRGGIREIEFIVQATQLLYGARYGDLTTRSTLKALDICESLGFLSAPHHKALKEAYIFYRRLENRIQYHRNLQTHQLPSDKGQVESLARLMGFAGKDPAGKLTREVSEKSKRVRGIFDLFFASDEEKKPAQTFPVSLDDEEATADWLDSLHFDRPRASAKALDQLRNGATFTHPSAKSKQAFDRFGPYIVSEAASTSWPDHVILGFANLVETRGGRDALYDLFDTSPAVIRLLSAIFSSSESLTAVLLRHPDTLDRLLAADPVGKPALREDYFREFESAANAADVIDRKLAMINAFRTGESLRLGLRRILDLSDRFELMNGLTILAEEYFNAVIRLAMENETSENYGSDVKWTLVAAGKLGRREMNFGSDIDLLAFYEPGETDPVEAREYVIRIIQRAIKLSGKITPSGAGYQIDMRLRPEGEGGPLALPYDSMIEYFAKRGQAWEKLALVGARAIAGDRAFGKKVEGAIRDFISGGALTLEEAGRIAKIREQITTEKIKPGAIDIKFGKGGLIEIEFICQWLAMENKEALEQSGPFTSTLLDLAGKKGWLDKKTANGLMKAYMLYRSIEDTLRMDREKSVNVIPGGDRILLNRLARAIDASVTPGSLLDLLRENRDFVRGAYLEFTGERVVGAKEAK